MGKHYYLVRDRIILAEIWRKKMEPMNASESIKTTYGSTLRPGESSV